MPIYGLGDERESRFVEIEYFVKNGKRIDGLHVTTQWVFDSLKFVTEMLRETLDDNAKMSLWIEGHTPIVVSARQLWKACHSVLRRTRRGELPDKIIAKVNSLEESFEYERKVSERHNL